MWKNVLLPLLLIIIAAALTVYFWYAEAPWSFIGMVGLVTLAISSMYIAYFIGYSIFPDKRNIPLPPLREVPRFYSEQKKHPQDITKGSLFSALLVIMFILLGVLGIMKLAKEYKYYELTRHGLEAMGVITEKGHTKGLGDYGSYTFKDANGKTYKDKCEGSEWVVGDSVVIRYSSRRPVINELVGR